MAKEKSKITASAVLSALKKHQNPAQAKNCLWFFKTGHGQYGEGDKFWGIKVPLVREVAKRFYDLSLPEIAKLLKNEVHEVRQIALFILVKKFEKSDHEAKKQIYDLYLKHTKFINNWDLVDLSAPQIVGGWLYQSGDWSVLKKLAKSKLLWDRRVSVLATFYFIKEGDFQPALAIAKMLLKDKQDLMRKAVGWMLREVGKRNLGILRKFLDQNIKQMPRTCLRYAIERFPEKERLAYLRK